MTRQEKIDKFYAEYSKAHDEWDKAHSEWLKKDSELVQASANLDKASSKRDKAEIELNKANAEAADDPEPQADDVDTIRDLEEVEEALQMAEKVGEETKNPTPWQFNTLMQVRRGKEALTRLSAPVDVQARAEAVVQEFSDTYDMLSADTEYELSRLIVEQFSRKG
jgi:chromosome segregation ATPase